MYVLMREFPESANQHNIYYSCKPEGVTSELEVAESWCKNLGWSGKQYYVEVEKYYEKFEGEN